VDRRYEAYCAADPLFYDSIANRPGKGLDFDAARHPLPPGWRRLEGDTWLVHTPEGAQLPPQGWKIHVSAHLANAERILATVWDYCIPRGISFKFLRGRHIFHMANAKYAPRGSSGKLVTIYPVDELQLELVLKELGEALEGEQGPYILSDLRWGAGPLYVRYGGFAPRSCLSPKGERVPAIEDPNGQLVPDRRDPVFKPPPWVKLPSFFLPHLAARNMTTTEGLSYRIDRALHFSNGGGVYLAHDARSDEQVILKEARPHAGLAADGADAVSRLRREREMLERLAGLDVAPGVRDCFTLGEHHFLVMEFIEGTSLNKFFGQRYPLIDPAPDEKTLAEYTSWALGIYQAVERAVDAIHQREVVFGDLHLFNIIVRPDDRVALIDFEVAAHISEKHRSGLGNPGFLAPRDRTGFEIDRYSLACLRLGLFLPLTRLLLLERDKAEHMAEVIAAHFPVPWDFLDEAVRVITSGSDGRGDGEGKMPARALRCLPRLTPDRPGWERARESMTRAILASATPERDDRLFPGDIQQFFAGGLNLAYGAAGVLYALSVTGAGRYPEYEEWLLRRALSRDEQTRFGFYDGLHGLAFLLQHLGYREKALELLDLCLGERWERLGLDLFGGLAGVGLNLLHFARVTRESSLRDDALRAADIMAGRLGDEDSVGEISGGEHPHAGLLYGSSGAALLFIRLHEETGDHAFLDLAAVALRQDLRRCVIRENGMLQVNEGWRTEPYLDKGSVGIGMVIDDYLTHRQDEQFASASAAIRRAARSPFFIQSGLFSGRAGIIAYLSHRRVPGAALRDPDVARQMDSLAWHALSYHGHLAFPGEQLLRLSMDLATGTAGVLLALGATLHNQPVHLPFLGQESSPS
jgi:tRNA A-37 threonylcarbamoyl transferase component Bud32